MKDNNLLETRLEEINSQLDDVIEAQEVDQELIHYALTEGVRIRESKESLTNNLVFILLAMSLFSIVGYMIASGFVTVVIVIQVIMVLMCPLLIPFVIYRQIKGGVL